MLVWNRPDLLDSFEKERDSKRRSGKPLAFDCFDMRCKGLIFAYCAKGNSFGLSHTVAIASILRGFTPEVCKICLEEREVESENCII